MKKNKGSLLSLLAGLTLLASCQTSTREILSEYNETKPLALMADREAGHDPRRSLVQHAGGTGFIWEGCHVVTANHSITDLDKSLGLKLYVDQFQPTLYKARYLESRGDVAIFRIDDIPALPSLKILDGNVEPFQVVYIVGWRKVIKARITLPELLRNLSIRDVSEGDSGAPIFNRSGRVIGIVHSTLTSGENKFVLYTGFYHGSPYLLPGLLEVKEE